MTLQPPPHSDKPCGEIVLPAVDAVDEVVVVNADVCKKIFAEIPLNAGTGADAVKEAVGGVCVGRLLAEEGYAAACFYVERKRVIQKPFLVNGVQVGGY